MRHLTLTLSTVIFAFLYLTPASWASERNLASRSNDLKKCLLDNKSAFQVPAIAKSAGSGRFSDVLVVCRGNACDFVAKILKADVSEEEFARELGINKALEGRDPQSFANFLENYKCRNFRVIIQPKLDGRLADIAATLLPEQLTFIDAELSRKLKVVHDSKVVHLDITDDNIMYKHNPAKRPSEQYEPYLIDFGISVRESDIASGKDIPFLHRIGPNPTFENGVKYDQRQLAEYKARLRRAPVQPTCPEISAESLKTLLNRQPLEKDGFIYVATTAEQSKFKNFFTTHKNYKPGLPLRFIEPFSSEEKGGKRTCAYRYESGLTKTDTMLIIEGTRKPK